MSYSDFLSGKTWYACGDSFTHGDFKKGPEDFIFEDEPYCGEMKVYPFFIGRRTGMVVKNIARNGLTMACNENRVGFSQELYKTIGDDADYITIMIGLNDCGQNIPIGNIDDDVNTTFYGAWNIVMYHLIKEHPYAKIGIIIPTCRPVAAPYAEAMRNVARRYGVPYLDQDKGEQVPLLVRSNREEVLPEIREMRRKAFVVSEENGHPNARMHEYESTIIETWLRTL